MSVHLVDVNEFKVCEIREVVDESDKRVGCDIATLQLKVREGVSKSRGRRDPRE